MIRITLQYFEGCPNRNTTDQVLAALLSEGWHATVEHELIDSYNKATVRGFQGSPTVLIDGVDPFAHPDAPPALACRVYQTETGPAGSPSIDQLRRAIASVEKGDSHGDQR
ncbi:MAG: thioredoxin family protein [Acidimicrobiia bacterium]